MHAEYRDVGIEIVHVLIEDGAGRLPAADFCTSWRDGSLDGGLDPVDPTPVVFMDAAAGWRGSYVARPTVQLPMQSRGVAGPEPSRRQGGVPTRRK